jgi:hypothetical protein
MIGRSRNVSVSIVSRGMLDFRDIRVLFPTVGRKFSLVTAPRPPLGSNQPHTQQVSEAFSPRINRPVREVDSPWKQQAGLLFDPENGSSTLFWNVGEFLLDYTASHPRRFVSYLYLLILVKNSDNVSLPLSINNHRQIGLGC